MISRILRRVAGLLLCTVTCGPGAAGDQASDGMPAGEATDRILDPFLTTYCRDCHGSDSPEAALDLSHSASADEVTRRFETWDVLLERVRAGEMPPPDFSSLPNESERSAFIERIESIRDEFAQKHDGAPGLVSVRRLNAAEYNYCIEDLTGRDLQPAAEFPVDPANSAGFDNSGESLNMTSALMQKYLQAARHVADCAVFLPDGLGFAPHPVLTDTDRDKYCVRRIVDYYDAQNTDLADYLYAASRSLDSAESPEFSDATRLSASLGISPSLSGKYLQIIRQWLDRDSESDDSVPALIQHVRETVRQLADDPDAAREVCRELAIRIRKRRRELGYQFPHLSVDGINRGSQPLVLWRNRQAARHRMMLNAEALGEHEAGSEVEWREFCRVFPDQFYVDRRGREYVGRKDEDDLNREGDYRLLSAGFHSMMGYFRDDAPLCELVLTDEEARELDRLWFELDFVAEAPQRQHSGFIWFERAEGRFLVDAEFDAFRSADRNALREDMIFALRDAYLAKAERLGAGETALTAMLDHFRRMNQAIRRVESAREAAEVLQLRSLVNLARRAWRRPLRTEEVSELREFYDDLRLNGGLSHDEAVRDVMVSILVSPRFCYRLRPPAAGPGVHPLPDHYLAERLSSLLWLGLPDAALRTDAAEGRLQSKETLLDHTERMRQDARISRFAAEFGGNWLGSRRFSEHNGVDRTRFPQFTDELREAMYEEPIRFLEDQIRQDRPVWEMLTARHTFANEVLAAHYNMSRPVNVAADGWFRVDSAAGVHRGGLLPMAAFLTANSPGRRTSPVKRGFWVVRRLLGTHIPAPPADVPELPEDEGELGELTVRDVLARHREHPSCAGCHQRFDSVGLVFESFGPVGEYRQENLAGNAVDVRAVFPDGVERTGIDGLRHYLVSARREEFAENLCRKLLSYSLGRSLSLSDRPLLRRMTAVCVQNDAVWSDLLKMIVSSPQFRNYQSEPGPE